MAYPNDAIVGPVAVMKVPMANKDGSTPSEGDVLYRGLDGLPTWGSSALVARSLESKTNLAAIQAMATISRAKVYLAADTGKQYMWTGGGTSGSWEVAEVNASLALGETSATAYRGDRGKTAYDHSQTFASAVEVVAGTDTAKHVSAKILKDSLASDGMWLTKRTKMPDGATASYFQDFTSTIDGFSVTGMFGTAPIYSGGYLVATRTGTGAGGIKFKANLVASHPAKQLLIKIKASTPTPVGVYSDSSAVNLMASANIGPVDTIIVCHLPITAYDAYIYLRSASGAVNDSISIDAVWIGDYSYLTGTLSEEAARIADQLGDSAGVGVAASGTITSNGTNVTLGNYVTIGGKQYVWRDSLSSEGDVLRDPTDYAVSLANMVAAINHDTGADTLYKCAAQNPLAKASLNGAVITITAGTFTGGARTGELGNQIVIDKSSVSLTCANAAGTTGAPINLSGGYSDAAAKMSQAVANATQGLAAKTSGVQADYEILLDSAAGFVKKKVLKSNLESTTQASGKRALYNAAAGLNANSISFPAVQVASSDANTLDDYEEGTWTPTLIGSTTPGTQTYTSQYGFYTKIGRQITLYFLVAISAKDAGIDGNALIGGSPFIASTSATGFRSGGVFGYIVGITNSSGKTYTTIRMSSSQQYIDVYEHGSNSASSPLPVSGISAPTTLAGTITYIV